MRSMNNSNNNNNIIIVVIIITMMMIYEPLRRGILMIIKIKIKKLGELSQHKHKKKSKITN